MKIAVYPGTFDPVTNGHLDILERAVKIFDLTILAVATDSNKAALFTMKERIKLLEEATAGTSGVKVESFDGLTVEFARSRGATTIVRGLRAISDFEYEFQLALMNKKIASDVETVFFMTRSDYAFISSSSIKWAARLHAAVSEFVPPNVEKALQEKYQDK